MSEQMNEWKNEQMKAMINKLAPQLTFQGFPYFL